MFKRLREMLLGKPLDPLDLQTQKHLRLAAFFAWVGLGADGLSSACYGPEEAFLALHGDVYLGIFLALAIAISVFLIAFAYNQVISLFPTGGGGYRVATQLLGPKAGLLSGAALIIDYVLTITISIASGVDALFSILPTHYLFLRVPLESVVIVVLIILNLRGMKESIKILLPIFLAFIVLHFFLIIAGILGQYHQLPTLVQQAHAGIHHYVQGAGWAGVLAIFLHAYSMGGGTYTGIEAVSNNVQVLTEPRVKTGKLTMLYMAVSLALMAAGILFLYLLWDVVPQYGKTLNAVVFYDILEHFRWPSHFVHLSLAVVLIVEALFLFVAANTGFLAGPAVLANMAADSWVPRQFRLLSSRLVKQNGVFLMGIGAFLILMITRGEVSLLVVLYSINVFLTFSLTLAGLSLYWIRQRKQHRVWKRHFLLSSLACLLCLSILIATIYFKFLEGGWATLLITGIVILACYFLKNAYLVTATEVKRLDRAFKELPLGDAQAPERFSPYDPTAIFILDDSLGAGIHSFLWVQRMFPNHFKNFIFVATKVVDAQSYGGEDALKTMQEEGHQLTDFFVSLANGYGLYSTSYVRLGVNPIDMMVKLSDELSEQFTNVIYFSSKFIFERNTWILPFLYNEALSVLQRELHFRGRQFVILPIKIS